MNKYIRLIVIRANPKNMKSSNSVGKDNNGPWTYKNKILKGIENNIKKGRLDKYIMAFRIGKIINAQYK